MHPGLKHATSVKFFDSKRLTSGHWNYKGACFQVSQCCTQTMTNGNTPCLLIEPSISANRHVKIIQVTNGVIYIYIFLF